MNAFHGMTADFDVFTDEKVGNGHDQEGPGIYLSSGEDDALTYCRGNGVLYTVEMLLTKTVPTKGKPNKRDVQRMMRAAPNLDETLTDWAEDKTEAFNDALASMLRGNTPHGAFQQVWYDFYRNTPVQFLRNMVTILGYDGVIVPKEGGVIHYIIYNPAVLTIRSKRIVKT